MSHLRATVRGMDDDARDKPFVLYGRWRRYVLTYVLLEAGRDLTISEIYDGVRALGFEIPEPVNKRISDGMRAIRSRGWVRRTQRGRYSIGTLPGSTLRRVRVMPARILRDDWLASWEL